MSGHNKPPAPAVATTGCSGLMSCLFLHRRAPPPSRGNAPVRPGQDAAAATRASTEQYRRRVQLLEEEVRRLGMRLAADAEHGSNTVNGATTDTRDQVSSRGSATGNRFFSEMVKLEDGGYLHEIKRVVGVPWERLALQVSPPVVAENAATASEVLDKMTETRAENLCKFLSKMMPIKDVAGRKDPGNVVRRSARLNSGDDFFEALLFKAMDKMEGLVQQGLKIQMASMVDSASATAAGDGERRQQATAASKDCMVYVVLIQVRDPKEGYAAIGDPMIGLMEAALEKKDGKVKLEVQGMDVAGILFSACRKRTTMFATQTVLSDGSISVEGDELQNILDLSSKNLSEDEVRARQDADTAKVGELFAIPPGFAAVLLRHYKWSLVELQDRLFCDDHVGAATGVSLDGVPVSVNDEPLICAICFDEHPAGEMRSAGCSHFYYVGCWHRYVHAAVCDGPRCMSFRCPDPAYSAAVVCELVDEVADGEDRARSYVEEGTKFKWCPGPGCTVAVEFVGGGGGGGEEKQDDVECTHGHGLCWRCGEEAHRPVSCERVRAWTEKNALESKTASWVLANAKHCPKCRLPIEKNQGCMRMKCRPPCLHEFCWLCLGPWDKHKNGQSYNCNIYDETKANGEVSGDKLRRGQGMASLDRYMHFYER
ncbi:hypothetical protein E2562_008832 [Oryza meyeriana var. granulata]|uniref:RBR-type E3 ubiquitin transferase n=1 Tax=Oryza meyeriana var. granulata TaxID=110450 RepID=A0A6G1CZ88_9ORYZ|nr:hypothetical protein E2562_008832 [Oryza meyeriana var. granulata]